MDTGDDKTEIYLFADDAKICRYITCTDDYLILQETVDKIQHWSDGPMVVKVKCRVRFAGGVGGFNPPSDLFDPPSPCRFELLGGRF